MQKRLYQSQLGNTKLILFFNGWAMTSAIIEELAIPEGYDLLTLWDYRTIELELELSRYEEIMLVAWSMGVWAADYFCQDYPYPLPIKEAVAICGTGYPMSDRRGIPREVFEGTLNGLDDANRMRFNRRMCGGKRLKHLLHTLQERTTEEIKGELEAVYHEELQGDDEQAKELTAPWTLALVGKKDRIIPYENQMRYWAEQDVEVVLLEDDDHYIFDKLTSWADLLTNYQHRGLNRLLIAKRFAKASHTYQDNAVVQKQMRERLLALLLANGKLNFNKVLEIGCGGGELSKLLQAHITNKSWCFNDLNAVPLEEKPFTLGEGEEMSLFIGDAETIALGESYDLIISNATMQWFNDPKAFINKMMSLLKPEGLLLFSSFGQMNLHEFKALTGVGLNYYTLEDYRLWLKGYDVIALEEEVLSLNFAQPLEVLRHLKATGVTASLTAPNFWTRDKLAKFIQSYQECYSNANGDVELSFHPIYFLARKS